MFFNPDDVSLVTRGELKKKQLDTAITRIMRTFEEKHNPRIRHE